MSKEKKKFKDTAIGSFLSDKAPDVLDFVGDSLPDSGVLGIVKSIVSKKGLSPEDQVKFDELSVAHEKEMFALEVQDRESARKREIDINNSESASWLSKNTASLIALAYTTFNFVIYVMILLGHMQVTNEMAVLIVNSITNIAMLIVGFYYGSSERRAKEFKTKPA
jgi:hypothetical protein